MKHSVKQKFKKALSLFLATMMLAGALPMTMINTFAAGNIDTILGEQDGDVYSENIFQGQNRDIFSALGFDTSVMPEGYDPDTVDNPFGRDKVVGNQVLEALVASQNGTGLFGKDNNDLTYKDIGGDTATGLALPFSLFAGAAADFDGDGLTGEVVYVGFKESEISRGSHEGRTPLYLMVYDAKTGKSSGTVSLGTANPAQVTPSGGNAHSQYDYAWQNLLQITAGDYDGDGMHEIAVYVPEHGNIRVDIYKFQKTSTTDSDDWLTIGGWSRVWTYVLSNSDGQIPNMVSLVSADINRDGIDDLGISYGRFTSGYNKAEEFTQSKALMLWGSRTAMLRSTTTLDLNDDSDGLGALTRVSLTTGDLDGDGYKELIATGHPMSDLTGYFINRHEGIAPYATNTTRTVTTYIYDSELGLVISQSEILKPVDGTPATYDEGGSTVTSWSSANGFDGKNYSQPLMRTNSAVIRLEGHDYPYLYIDSYLYEFVEGKLVLKMSLDEEGNIYDGTKALQVTSDTANGHWGVSVSSNGALVNADYAEFGAVSGDINGKGYDVLMTGFFRDSSLATASKSSHNSGFGVLSSTSDGTLAIKTDNNGITKDSDVHDSTKLRYPLMVDADKDTVILEYTGIHYLEYSDPKIIAVLAAAPYFEDVERVSGYDYAWQNVTGYSKTDGSGDGDMKGLDFEGGFFSDKEVTLTGNFFVSELAVMFTLEYNDETTKVTEYTLTFEAEQDQDSVAFFSVPTEVYVYNVYTPDENGNYTVTEELITNQFEPVKQILTLDYYESIQESYKELPQIKGAVLTSTPGDPSSYPSSTTGYNVVNEWNQDPAGVSFGTGTITQEITFTEEHVKSHNFGAALDYKIGGGFDFTSSVAKSGSQVALGGQFSLNPTGGDMDINLNGTTISGSVANMPEEFRDYGYYFNWKLFSYSCTVDGATFPVVSYIVNDVSEPPSLPKDFQQDYDRSTDSMNVLTWTYDEAFSSFKLYKYFDFPIGGGLQLIQEIPSDTFNYRIKYDADGKMYKEYYYEDKNLAPYTEYQYAIQVERLSKIPPLSALSELISVRTKARYGNPLMSIDESDGENDGKVLAYPDKAVHMIATVTGPDGEAPADYYTTVQYQWQKNNKSTKGAWVDMVNETDKTLTFMEASASDAGLYRCRINVITNTDATAISVYTDAVELTQSLRTSYIEEVDVYDVVGGGVYLNAKVSNAHSDSATVPGGYVSFLLTEIATDRSYQYSIALRASGQASTVLYDTLPQGVYLVTVSYSGDTYFKPSHTETMYLSQTNNGLYIDTRSSTNYGDGAEIIFHTITKQGGITTSQEQYAASYALYHGDKLSYGYQQGATRIEQDQTVTKGKSYLYYNDSNLPYHFVASYSGTVKIYGTHVVYTSNETYSNYITYTNDGGKYTVAKDLPAGAYVAMMYNDKNMSATAYFEVERRPITVQLPTLEGGEGSGSSTDAPAILIKDLAVIEGEWAEPDLVDGVLADQHASKEVLISYINTAGTVYSKTTVDALCGYYMMTADAASDGLFPNYDITYADGSYSVIGATRDIYLGVRDYEGRQVGTIYSINPEFAYTREPYNTGASIHQATGTRIVLSAVPDSGYAIYDWYINGVAQNTTSTTISYVVQADAYVRIEVQFAVKETTLSYDTAGDAIGGTITVSQPDLTSDSFVLPNTRLTFTAVAKEGYHFKEWRYTEQGRGTVYDDSDYGKDSSTYDFLMPTVGAAVYAVFERDFYTLTYEDLAGIGGLTAYYEGALTSDSMAQKERIYLASGDKVKGDTVIIVAPKPGYVLDEEFNFVSVGSRGVADYASETFTFSLTEDSHVTAYTKQEFYDLSIEWDMSEGIDLPTMAYTLTYSIGTDNYSSASAQSLLDPETGIPLPVSVTDVPGGSPVTLSIATDGRLVFHGFYSDRTRMTATTARDHMAAMIFAGDPVEAGKSYCYVDSSTGSNTIRYFTSPADGIFTFEADAVTVLQDSYSIDAVAQDETVKIKLSILPTYDIYLNDVSEYATIEADYSFGSLASVADGVTTYSMMKGDTLTLTVLPKDGRTISQWQVEADGEIAYVPATGLKYVIPEVSQSVTLTPTFVGGLYNKITWPTIDESRMGVSLRMSDGYLDNLSSGSDFQFTLNGPLTHTVLQVLANGEPFVPTDGPAAGNYTYYTYETWDRTTVTVYTIHNVYENTEITVIMDEVGVYVNGVDIGQLSGDGWQYDPYNSVLTITKPYMVISGNTHQYAPKLTVVTGEEVDQVTFDNLRLWSYDYLGVPSIPLDQVVFNALADDLTVTLIGETWFSGVMQGKNLSIGGTGTMEMSGVPTVQAERLTLIEQATLTNHASSSNEYPFFSLPVLWLGRPNTPTDEPTLITDLTVEADTINMYGGMLAIDLSERLDNKLVALGLKANTINQFGGNVSLDIGLTSKQTPYEIENWWTHGGSIAEYYSNSVKNKSILVFSEALDRYSDFLFEFEVRNNSASSISHLGLTVMPETDFSSFTITVDDNYTFTKADFEPYVNAGETKHGYSASGQKWAMTDGETYDTSALWGAPCFIVQNGRVLTFKYMSFIGAGTYDEPEDTPKYDYKISGYMENYGIDATDNAVNSLILDSAFLARTVNVGSPTLSLSNTVLQLNGYNLIAAKGNTGQDIIQVSDGAELWIKGQGTGSLEIQSAEYALSCTGTATLKLSNIGHLLMNSSGGCSGTFNITYYDELGMDMYLPDYSRAIEILGGSRRIGARQVDGIGVYPYQEIRPLSSVGSGNTITIDLDKDDPNKFVVANFDAPVVNGKIPQLIATPMGNGYDSLIVGLYEDSHLIRSIEFVHGAVNDDYPNLIFHDDIFGWDWIGFQPKLVSDLPLGTYTMRLYFEDQAYSEITIILTASSTDGNLTVGTEQSTAMGRGDTISFSTAYNSIKPSSYKWFVNGEEQTGVVGAGFSFTVPADAGIGTTYTIRAESYDNYQKRLGFDTVTLTVVATANGVVISSDSTPESDGSYAVHLNPDGANPLTMSFDVAVDLNDGKPYDASRLTWSLWGHQRRATVIDENGNLSISPAETGTGGIIKVIATYTDANGVKRVCEVTVKLSTAHTFENVCATQCLACDYVRDTAEHVFGNDCDTVCDTEGCGYTREVGDHVYSYDCDTTCDIEGCGVTRAAAEHTYNRYSKVDSTGHTAACVCGETVTEAHTLNAQGYCELCETRIIGASIKVGNDLTMNYYVHIANESLLADISKIAMRFTMAGRSVTVYAGEPNADGAYVFAFENIAPQQMGDLIDAQLVLIDGDSVTVLDEVLDYTLKDNAQALLTAYPDNAALVQLVTDMLIYGDAAQAYKDYNLDDLATVGITGLGTPSEALPTATDMTLTPSKSAELAFSAAGVWFDHVNNLYVKFSSPESAKIIVKIDNKVVGTYGDFNSGILYTDPIFATDFDTVYTFELYECTSDGEELVQVLTYSVQSYVYSMMNSTEEDGVTLTEIAELSRALYRYGKSAEAYRAATAQ